MNDAYLAGFLDADGSLSIKRSGAIRVRFTNTDRRHLQLLQLALGGAGCLSRQVPGTEKHRTTYSLDLSGADAMAALRRMLPHLRVKQKRAELLIAAYHSPPEVRREVWRPQLMRLNRKGPSGDAVDQPDVPGGGCAQVGLGPYKVVPSSPVGVGTVGQ